MKHLKGLKAASIMVVIAMMFSLAACTGKNKPTDAVESSTTETESETIDPLGKYEPGIEVTSIAIQDDTVKFENDESYDNVGEEEKIRRAIEIEKAALSFDKRVKRVRKASYNASVRYERIVNSKGVDAEHAATYFSGSVTAVAEDVPGSGAPPRDAALGIDQDHRLLGALLGEHEQQSLDVHVFLW